MRLANLRFVSPGLAATALRACVRRAYRMERLKFVAGRQPASPGSDTEVGSRAVEARGNADRPTD
jgi:hypothetical protein